MMFVLLEEPTEVGHGSNLAKKPALRVVGGLIGDV